MSHFYYIQKQFKNYRDFQLLIERYFRGFPLLRTYLILTTTSFLKVWMKTNKNKNSIEKSVFKSISSSVKENGFNDPIVDRDSGPPPAKRHQSLLSPTISSRTSPAGLAPLLLHHPTGHHSHQLTAPSILHSHLSTSGRSMFDDSNSSTPSALYHNTNNSRDNTTNGRNHSSHTSADHMNDRYSSVDRFEREYCRPSVGLYSQIQRDFTDDRDMDEEWKNINTVSLLSLLPFPSLSLIFIQKTVNWLHS